MQLLGKSHFAVQHASETDANKSNPFLPLGTYWSASWRLKECAYLLSRRLQHLLLTTCLPVSTQAPAAAMAAWSGPCRALWGRRRALRQHLQHKRLHERGRRRRSAQGGRRQSHPDKRQRQLCAAAAARVLHAGAEVLTAAVTLCMTTCSCFYTLIGYAARSHLGFQGLTCCLGTSSMM